MYILGRIRPFCAELRGPGPPVVRRDLAQEEPLFDCASRLAGARGAGGGV